MGDFIRRAHAFGQSSWCMGYMCGIERFPEDTSATRVLDNIRRASSGETGDGFKGLDTEEESDGGGGERLRRHRSTMQMTKNTMDRIELES